ncbi:amidohydrolase family protein [bacterium]|nr:amidohydrolase family protein [bacterium]
MTQWSSKAQGITDGHVHVRRLADVEGLHAIRQAAGIDRMNLVAIQNAEAGAGLPAALYAKALQPDGAFVFAGLNHAAKLSGGAVAAPSLAEQAASFVAMGCDGIKMIEGKPTSRQRLNVPVTDPYYADYWARVEELGAPIVWHVNDPEEFWDPETTPGWAKERNWGYGPDDVRKEALYAEVDEVLARHPDLRVIFAHFYFLSADLARAARFLDAHPRVCFDLAPGIEMLYNISRDAEAGREFFLRYADRIVFGTDLSSGNTLPESRARAGIVFRWLESDDTFRVPDEADFLLGPPEDGVIRGMALPDAVLDAIYRTNFARVAGETPRPLNVEGVVGECERIARIAAALSGVDAAQTEAGLVAEKCRT